VLEIEWKTDHVNGNNEQEFFTRVKILYFEMTEMHFMLFVIWYKMRKYVNFYWFLELLYGLYIWVSLSASCTHGLWPTF